MNKTESLLKELLGLEKKYWQAMRDHDLETAMSLTDFPCLVAGPHGVRSVTKDDYKKMFESRKQDNIKSFKFDEKNAKVRQLTEDTAVVAYQVETAFTHEGEEKSMKAVDTSTWIRRDGTWVCAMHAEAELAH